MYLISYNAKTCQVCIHRGCLLTHLAGSEIFRSQIQDVTLLNDLYTVFSYNTVIYQSGFAKLTTLEARIIIKPWHVEWVARTGYLSGIIVQK